MMTVKMKFWCFLRILQILADRNEFLTNVVIILPQWHPLAGLISNLKTPTVRILAIKLFGTMWQISRRAFKVTSKSVNDVGRPSLPPVEFSQSVTSFMVNTTKTASMTPILMVTWCESTAQQNPSGTKFLITCQLCKPMFAFTTVSALWHASARNLPRHLHLISSIAPTSARLNLH